MKTRIPLLCLWPGAALLWYAAVAVYSAPKEVVVTCLVQKDTLASIEASELQQSIGVAPVSGSDAKDNCISLNTAGVDLLVTLPGIGPAIAKRIVEFRQVHGKFNKVDELDAVKGIGPATLRKIGGLVCL